MIWATVAAELARYGLGRVATQLEKNPTGRIALDVARELGVTPTPQAISDKIASDPAALEALQRYEMALLEMDEVSRERANEANKGHPVLTFFSGLTLMLMAAAFIVALFFVPIPAGNAEAIMLALGFVLGWAGAYVNYKFGSSAGSADKSTTINRIATK